MIKTIVLAGDRNYIRQLETTIKSILYHNRDVKIYILNQDKILCQIGFANHEK
ncbi:putative glycosyltransferase [Streptococcus pneumoniae]|nr:putative glycosyltransferase [Streptococcus pneumoniae]